MNLGTLAAELGNQADAQQFYNAAKQALAEQKHTEFEGLVTAMSGLAHLDADQPEEARRCLTEAYRLAQTAGDERTQVTAQAWHGLVHWLSAEEEPAFLRLQSAVRLLMTLQDPPLYGFVHGYFGALLAGRGRVVEAERALRHARQQAQRSGDRNQRDNLKVLVGIAAAGLAANALEKDSDGTYARHRAMALSRAQFAIAPVAATDAYPDGLPAPAERSVDVRISLRLLHRLLAELPEPTAR
jgi:tetratricopeptide (TPR) repeat protein